MSSCRSAAPPVGLIRPRHCPPPPARPLTSGARNRPPFTMRCRRHRRSASRGSPRAYAPCVGSRVSAPRIGPRTHAPASSSSADRRAEWWPPLRPSCSRSSSSPRRSSWPRVPVGPDPRGPRPVPARRSRQRHDARARYWRRPCSRQPGTRPGAQRRTCRPCTLTRRRPGAAIQRRLPPPPAHRPRSPRRSASRRPRHPQSPSAARQDRRPQAAQARRAPARVRPVPVRQAPVRPDRPGRRRRLDLGIDMHNRDPS